MTRATALLALLLLAACVPSDAGVGCNPCAGDHPPPQQQKAPTP